MRRSRAAIHLRNNPSIIVVVKLVSVSMLVPFFFVSPSCIRFSYRLFFIPMTNNDSKYSIFSERRTPQAKKQESIPQPAIHRCSKVIAKTLKIPAVKVTCVGSMQSDLRTNIAKIAPDCSVLRDGI